LQVDLYDGADENTKKKTLSLRIQNLRKDDFGEYTCYAENGFGRDSETMILYGRCLCAHVVR